MMHFYALMAQKVAFLTMAFFLAGISGMGYGEEHCWRHAPTLYNAVHFHEDYVPTPVNISMTT